VSAATVWDRRGPLAGKYWFAVLMVICALTPFLVLSSSIPFLSGMIGKDVGLGDAGLEMSAGLADAAYCFGTVLAIQLVTKLHGRRLLLGYAGLFTVATALTAAAASPGVFMVGRVLQGLSTSLMLITAAPTLVLGFPTKRMQSTAIVMNMGIFGAVALGPVIGGAFAGLESWRALFWIMTGVGAVAFALVLLTFEDQAPQDREVRFDPVSLLLASVGCTSAFFGASSLTNHAFTSPVVLVPLVVGILLIVGLIVHQASVADPLMPVRKLAHTIPVAAVVLAMFAGAGSVALTGLLTLVIESRDLSTAVFWPEFGGAVVTALLFGRFFFTRYVPVLVIGGLLLLTGAAVFLTGAATDSTGLLAVGTGAIGLGVGASVAPGLFVAGFSLPAMQLPRVFALVELLRGVAAFLTAPLLIHLATTHGGGLDAGIEAAVWATFGLLLVGALLVGAIVWSGGVRLQRPDIEPWLANEKTALDSPALGAALRRRRGGAAVPDANG
jgi:MFS family permease